MAILGASKRVQGQASLPLELEAAKYFDTKDFEVIHTPGWFGRKCEIIYRDGSSEYLATTTAGFFASKQNLETATIIALFLDVQAANQEKSASQNSNGATSPGEPIKKIAYSTNYTARLINNNWAIWIKEILLG